MYSSLFLPQKRSVYEKKPQWQRCQSSIQDNEDHNRDDVFNLILVHVFFEENESFLKRTKAIFVLTMKLGGYERVE